MRFFITGDSNEEAGLGRTIYTICGPTVDRFKKIDYGTSLQGVVVVLMCRAPYLKFKQRIRLVKKDKKLYLDIMLDYREMTSASPEQRRQIIISRLQTEIPEILARYKLSDFNKERFLNDMKTWLESQRTVPLWQGAEG